MALTRVASSVLLTRGRGSDVEVYLVLRNPDLRFFGGYWAVPGGALDEVDRVGSGADEDEDEALRRCGLRELFEETGVLGAGLRAALGGGDAAVLRSGLLQREPVTAAWAELLSAEPVSEPRTILTLTTPDFSAIRFRTRFLHLELPAGEQPSVIAGELVDGRFVRPDEAVRAWRAGELLIAPPVLRLLELLAECGLAGMFESAAQVERELVAGKLHPVRHTPGIFTAPLRTPTIPPATTTNCYLVGHRDVWVVDPATYEERERARLYELMDEWLAQGRRFAGILLTHHHADHVGSVSEVSARYGLPVRGHELTLARTPGSYLRGTPLADGDELDLGRSPDERPGWKLRALHTPGHDRGHLAFHENRYGALIAGDLVSTLSTIVIDPPEGHMATYLTSLRRVLAEPVEMIYPAHGIAWRDGKALLRQYLQHREQREAKLVAALGRNGARPAEQLLGEVYDDVAPELRALARRSLLAGLLKLEEEERARRFGEAWSASG